MGSFGSIAGAETALTRDFGRHVFEIAALLRVSCSLYNYRVWVVGATGIEPVTPSMSTRCSPAELRALELSDGLRSVYRLQSGQARMPSRGLDRESGRQHLVHFADQFAKMDRLGQHFGILRCFGIGI